MNTQLPKEIENWQNSIGKATPQQMASLYTKEAVLLPTYDQILKGTARITAYFVDFLDKKDMNCRIIKNETKNLPGGYKVSNGYYVFSFKGDDGDKEQVLARYTYVTDANGKIITHHSSEQPETDD
ncbi:MAG TPA: DUF4440 domain-containing protein [Flavobacteriaceae bacterium]|nr:DUF4440 domain-containing protein [Flavobacteriaceae bacterium]